MAMEKAIDSGIGGVSGDVDYLSMGIGLTGCEWMTPSKLLRIICNTRHEYWMYVCESLSL